MTNKEKMEVVETVMDNTNTNSIALSEVAGDLTDEVWDAIEALETAVTHLELVKVRQADEELREKAQEELEHERNN